MSISNTMNCKRFLFLWKDAYTGIAEVEDVRKRLAGLKGVSESFDDIHSE
jgi:hypothetical protein